MKKTRNADKQQRKFSRAQIMALIRQCADDLGSRDVEFILSPDEPDDPSAWAEFRRFYGQSRAEIRIAEELLSQRPDDVIDTLYHECAHSRTWKIMDIIEDIRPLIPRPTYKALRKLLRREIEYITDGHAGAMTRANMEKLLK